VVSTQSKNLLSKWESSPNRGENKKYVKPPRYIYTLKKKVAKGKCHLSSFREMSYSFTMRWYRKKTARNGILWKVYHGVLTLLISHATRLKLTSYQHYPRFEHKLVGIALYHNPKQAGTRNDHSYTANMRFWHWTSSYHQVAILNFLDVILVVWFRRGWYGVVCN